MAEIKQNLFTLSANLLTLRKAVTRLQEKLNSIDKAKGPLQPEENVPSATKRKSPSLDQLGFTNHMALQINQKAKVSPQITPNLVLTLNTTQSSQEPRPTPLAIRQPAHQLVMNGPTPVLAQQAPPSQIQPPTTQATAMPNISIQLGVGTSTHPSAPNLHNTVFATLEDLQFQATPSRGRPQRPPTPDEIQLLTTNLERFFAPEVVQYAKEQSDKWRQYNIRMKGFWERKDELKNPYIIDRRFRG